jgi:hypothetical protein
MTSSSASSGSDRDRDRAPAHGLGPRSESLGRQIADPLDLVDRAEVREQDDRAECTLADAFDRTDRELEVVVGGRRGRAERTRIGRVDAERVAGEHGAGRGVRERQVVLGVARRGEGLEVPPAELDAIAVAERADTLGRNRFDGPEQRRGGLGAVDRRHARDEARGVGEVSGAAFVHPDGGVREAFGDPPHPAGVVQVDVRDGDVREVGGPDPEPFQPRDHGLEGGARSGFDDRGLVGVEEIGGGGAFATAVERVDRA